MNTFHKHITGNCREMNLIEDKFGGKVFTIFSLDGEVGNSDVVDKIRSEIDRLSVIDRK